MPEITERVSVRTARNMKIHVGMARTGNEGNERLTHWRKRESRTTADMVLEGEKVNSLIDL